MLINTIFIHFFSCPLDLVGIVNTKQSYPQDVETTLYHLFSISFFIFLRTFSKNTLFYSLCYFQKFPYKEQLYP